MLKGGCFCGFIRYVTEGPPFNSVNCHCSICRRTTGAAFVTWFSVKRTAFRFTSGVPTIYASSERAQRSFCPRCGSQLTFASNHFPDEIDVTTCSLQNPEDVPPESHIYTSTRVPWVKLADGLPEFRESSATPPAGG